MSSPSFRRTFKRPRKIKTKSLVKVFEVTEIKSDIEFSNFFKQLLEKKETFISKSARKVEEGKFENFSTKSTPDNSESKNFETKPINYKTPHNSFSSVTNTYAVEKKLINKKNIQFTKSKI